MYSPSWSWFAMSVASLHNPRSAVPVVEPHRAVAGHLIALTPTGPALTKQPLSVVPQLLRREIVQAGQHLSPPADLHPLLPYPGRVQAGACTWARQIPEHTAASTLLIASSAAMHNRTVLAYPYLRGWSNASGPTFSTIHASRATIVAAFAASRRACSNAAAATSAAFTSARTSLT